MGIYAEYLDLQLDFSGITAARKTQLARLSALRDRDVLVIAADLRSRSSSLTSEDLLPIRDQLSNLAGNALDVILETPGGSGEAAEDIVRMLRQKYKTVGVIVPGTAKSAGTIMVMAGDEIMMGHDSAVGPIDAQISWQGKVFSADALLQGMEQIKEEVERTNKLNRAYIPMLQNLSPGELVHAQHAQAFAANLVREWLVRYKFKDWNTHSTSGKTVTNDEKEKRAKEIAARLCDHQAWKTHSRSIHLDNLAEMGLRITNFDEDPSLAEAIRRYYVLLRMTFDTTIYKVFETSASQIYRFESLPVSQLPPPTAQMSVLELTCKKCQKVFKVQANLDDDIPLQPGHIAFPDDNKLKCPGCGTEHDLIATRQQLEAQNKRKVQTPPGLPT